MDHILYRILKRWWQGLKTSELQHTATTNVIHGHGYNWTKKVEEEVANLYEATMKNEEALPNLSAYLPHFGTSSPHFGPSKRNPRKLLVLLPGKGEISRFWTPQ